MFNHTDFTCFNDNSIVMPCFDGSILPVLLMKLKEEHGMYARTNIHIEGHERSLEFYRDSVSDISALVSRKYPDYNVYAPWRSLDGKLFPDAYHVFVLVKK